MNQFIGKWFHRMNRLQPLSIGHYRFCEFTIFWTHSDWRLSVLFIKEYKSPSIREYSWWKNRYVLKKTGWTIWLIWLVNFRMRQSCCTCRFKRFSYPSRIGLWAVHKPRRQNCMYLGFPLGKFLPLKVYVVKFSFSWPHTLNCPRGGYG